MGTPAPPGTNSGRLNKAPASSYSQYVIVRQRLDDLGYNSYLSNDSVQLVEKLLNDLVRFRDFHSKKAGEANKNNKVSSKLSTF